MGVPLAAIVERAATMVPAARRGELLRLPGGITLIDDSYNSSPAALKKALETVAASTGSARKIAVLGEMLELGAHADRLHAECGRAAAAAGLDLLIAVGGDAAGRLADAAREAGMDRAAVIHVADQRRGRRSRAPEGAARRSRAGEGLARHPHRRRRRSAEGGVRLMFYHLIYGQLSHALADPDLQRVPVHHLPDRGRDRDGAGAQPGAGADDDPPAARLPDRAGHPAGRAADASRQGRHADDGRPADPGVRDRADAALGEPDERLHLDRRDRHDGVRRRRLRRRLPEDRAPLPSRPAAALQDGLAGHHRRRRRPGAAACWCGRTSTTRACSSRSSSG